MTKNPLSHSQKSTTTPKTYPKLTLYTIYREFDCCKYKTHALFLFDKMGNCLAWRFRIKKVGGFCPDESPFGVRLPPYGGTEGGRSDEKSGEIWPKSDLF